MYPRLTRARSHSVSPEIAMSLGVSGNPRLKGPNCMEAFHATPAICMGSGGGDGKASRFTIGTRHASASGTGAKARYSSSLTSSTHRNSFHRTVSDG